jgi:choline dehydrogenase
MRSFAAISVAAAVAFATGERLLKRDESFSYTIATDPPQAIFPPTGSNWPATAPPNASYDYVVVGSGAGGSPVAARLALAGYSVLLLDAGEDHGTDRQIEVPALHPFASDYGPISWDYFVSHYANETQAVRDSKMTYLSPDNKTYYSGLDPPKGYRRLGVRYPRTGALGGCTMHNALVTLLPAESDWDGIASLTGDKSWSAANMRGYYEKLEKCSYLPQGTPGHGFSGWLQTQVTPLLLVAEDLKVTSIALAACTAIGKGLISSLLGTVTGLASLLALDINAPVSDSARVEDIYQIPLSMKTPEYSRSSPRDWVVEIAGAKNNDGTRKYHLDIALTTLATKVVFDSSSTPPRAIGVDYVFGKSLYRADSRSSSSSIPAGIPGTVRANREVILSAGAFNTPQLLKLSGVDPATELSRFSIPVIADRPGVGGNMQDRYEIGTVGKANSDFSLLSKCTFLNSTTTPDPCYDEWANKNNVNVGKGPYTTNGIAFGYLHRSSVAETADADLFLGGVPAYFNGYFPGYSLHATADRSIWTFLTLKAHSRNRAGTVNLTSDDPRDMPAITFHSLGEGSPGGDKDLQAIYEGMQWGMRALADVIPLGLSGFSRVWPPPELTTEDQLKQFIRDETWGHHASCTCPIGTDDDPMAVLDGDFRVRGVQGLRVVDASVFPTIPGTYIVLPIYMVAEKAADIIIAAARAS